MDVLLMDLSSVPTTSLTVPPTLLVMLTREPSLVLLVTGLLVLAKPRTMLPSPSLVLPSSKDVKVPSQFFQKFENFSSEKKRIFGVFLKSIANIFFRKERVCPLRNGPNFRSNWNSLRRWT